MGKKKHENLEGELAQLSGQMQVAKAQHLNELQACMSRLSNFVIASCGIRNAQWSRYDVIKRFAINITQSTGNK